MNISWRWLRDLVPGLEYSPKQVADVLAMQGAPVDEIVDTGAPLRDVVIGRVVEARRHPNADRLSVCSVDTGNGALLNVVCGAPNVRAGAFYPFAPVGAQLPGGITLRKAKIRGEESQGMLCSARELGLGRDHEGILELHGELVPGRSFIESAALDDASIVVDVTPNRPDLLSHLGVAREVAAAAGLRPALFTLPGAPVVPQPAERGAGAAEASAAGVSVAIEAPDLCPRYFGLVIRGVRVAPSPEWLAGRLRVLGLRPISNVVDATNWVLHELGQPLHAFDLARLGDRVVVRRARAGERITTLDGADRALQPDMLVIADATRPVAVAGVMGGADTEVHEGTTDILLECALFDARSVRATRRALNLSTDASYRFERGVDPALMPVALRRAAELIVAVAGGSVAEEVAAPGGGVADVAPIRLRLARVATLLGERFDGNAVRALLEPLGYTVRDDGAGAVHVDVPSHRRYDVTGEVDLIEDIARRHGYDTFPDDVRPFRPGTVPTHPHFLLEDALRDLLVARGFLEARMAAFAPEPEGDVALLLPLAATESRLRRALLPGLLRRVEYNFARGARSIRLFELGTAFGVAASDDLPAETLRLAVACTGYRRPPHFTEPAAAFDVWDIRAIADAVAGALGLVVEPAAGPDEGVIDPAYGFVLRAADGTEYGRAGRVQPGRVDAPAWADDVWGLEVRVEPPAEPEPVRYRAVPQFPAIERDLALLLPDGVAAAAVQGTVRAAGGALLEDVHAFDLYEGSGLPAGTRSVAFRLRFRAADRTLADAEVEPQIRRILQRLEADHGVQQRT